MSQYYDIALRLDSSDSGPLVAWLNSDGGAYLVVKEMEDENPHFHVFLRSSRKVSALRTSFKRAFPDTNGNGAYSLAACRDTDRYYRYMMKGEAREVMPMVVAANGMEFVSGDWQKKQHDDYWDENEEIGRRRKLAPVPEAVLAACKDARIKWDDREKIAELYIRELVARDKAINLFSVRSNISLLQCKLCPDDSAIKSLANFCVNY